jgi:hypothetical protein
LHHNFCLKVWEGHDLAVGDTLTAAEKAAGTAGFSDPYCVVELLDKATLQPLKGRHAARKFKTPTVKRSLAPVWSDAEVTWPNLVEPISQVVVKVTVCNAGKGSGGMLGMQTKDAVLGGFTVPLSVCRLKGGAGPRWYPLEDVPEMAAGVKVRARLCF